MLEICAELKRASVPTYGWVNPNAYSGGAIIALACDEIILSSGATMGDAAPVSGNPITFAQGLQDTERQKILAPILAEIVESARLNGYDEKLVQSLVTLGVELWWVEDSQTGERYFVDEAEYRALFDEDPPRIAMHVQSGSASAGDAKAEKDDEEAESEDSPEPDEEAGGVLNQGAGGSPAGFQSASDRISPETVNEINKTIVEPTTRPDFENAEPGRFTLVHYATDGKTLLTLKERDLKLYGFANDTVDGDADLKQYFGAKNLARLDQSWSESMVGLMTVGMSGLLFRGAMIVLFLLGLFIEMSMPGLGLPGGVALLALAGLVVPPMLIGAASWWAAVVILLGVVLIATEIFVFPGFGVPGIAGMACLLVGFVGSFAGVGELFPGSATGDYTQSLYALSITGVSLFVSIALMFLFTRYTHKMPVVGGLVLAEGGPRAGGGILEAMSDEAPGHTHLRVGDEGETITTLRPSGTARFGDDLIDVVAKLGFIESGLPVVVEEITDFRIIVRAASDDGAPHPVVPPVPPAPPGPPSPPERGGDA